MKERKADLFVSPGGSDRNPGTEELPFRTITAARDAARRRSEPVTVEVQAGVYTECLEFDRADSGDTYLTRENAVITGGVQIPYRETEEPSEEMRARLCPEAAERVRAIDLKRYGVSREVYETLYAIGRYSTDGKYDGVSSGVNLEVFEDGCRMTLARYPNQGWLTLADVADVGDAAEFPPQNYWRGWEERRNHRSGLYLIDEETNERVKGWGKFAGEANERVKGWREPDGETNERVKDWREPARETNEGVKDWRKPDGETNKSVKGWREPDEVWMAGYFYWDWADSSTPVRFCTENRAVIPAFVSRFGARRDAMYYFYNVPEELDVPGEFWIDRKEGILYVYPRGRADSLFEISVADRPLIKFSGACNMTFEGFALTNVRHTAVEGRGDGNVLRGLSVRNAAVHGIDLAGYRNLAEDCEVSHTGCGGIYLTGGEREALIPGENAARNNFVHDFARVCRTYQAGVRLQGVGNRCEHNEICGSPHLAVSYEGNEHVIEYNYIHDVVQHSGDAGAVYSGFDWAAHETVIRYNLIENVGDGEFAPNGIYWDDGLSGQTAYGNILRNVKGRAFLAGGGRDNVIRGNLILGECVAPVSYDDRNREGFFHGGWARASCAGPEAPHWRKLAAVPYRSEIWRERYPTLARVTTDFARAQEADFPVNPANVVLENNIVIGSGGSLGEIAQSVYDFNEIGRNPVYASAEEADFDELTLKFRHPREDFPEIPVEKIGRLENEKR